MNNFAALGLVAILGLGAAFYMTRQAPVKSVDLGMVLDRTEFALVNYKGYSKIEIDENATEATPEQMEEFITFYRMMLNASPVYYQEKIGVEWRDDGSFIGFPDRNFDNLKNADEKSIFKVEVDIEKKRLIATGMEGDSTDMRYSGPSFVTGMLLGRVLGRQRTAGISSKTFANRSVTPRSSYKHASAAKAKTKTRSARSSSRSGGVRTGK